MWLTCTVVGKQCTRYALCTAICILRMSVLLQPALGLSEPDCDCLSLSLFGNKMTIVNIVDCVPRLHHVWRKQNTTHMDKRNIMVTDDLHCIGIRDKDIRGTRIHPTLDCTSTSGVARLFCEGVIFTSK